MAPTREQVSEVLSLTFAGYPPDRFGVFDAMADAVMALIAEAPQPGSLDARVAHLGTLTEDWDSYGGHPPTEQALAALRSMAVVPVPTGGVQVEWHCNGQDIEIEILPDGRIEVDDLTEAPQPWVLLRATTSDSSERWFAKPGRSFLEPAELPVPPGTRVAVVVIEDTEAPNEHPHRYRYDGIHPDCTRCGAGPLAPVHEDTSTPAEASQPEPPYVGRPGQVIRFRDGRTTAVLCCRKSYGDGWWLRDGEGGIGDRVLADGPWELLDEFQDGPPCRCSACGDTENPERSDGR